MEMASVSQAPLSKEPIGDENNPRRVLIIYTGGTIGMKPLDDGSLAPSQGYLTEVLRTMPELTRPGMPQHDVIEYDPLLDSSSMGPVDWRKIACDIETAESTYDGFVVCMGTDTMCYCASALSFMLENLHKPVILTGSLVPHFEIHTDARRNLLCSIVFSANCEIPEVCICFDDKLLRGNRCTKVSSNGFNAFDTPNYPPLAIVGARIYYRHHLTLPMPAQRLRVHKNLECSISVIRLVPGFDDACLFAMARHTPGLKAIVLELYGTGNGPSSKTSLLVAIAEAHKQNILVAAITQCYKGGVSLSSYALGRELQKRGVVEGGDMTAEAIVSKIAYLFARSDSLQYVSHFLQLNLRGELSPVGTARRGTDFLADPKKQRGRLFQSARDAATTEPVAKTFNEIVGRGGTEAEKALKLRAAVETAVDVAEPLDALEEAPAPGRVRLSKL